MTIRLDEAHGGVWRNDEFVELTPFQFRIVTILTWGETGSYADTDDLCQAMHMSRDALHHHMKFLSDRLGEPRMIFNRRGWGYRIDRDA
jgi:hypothetical protein